MRIDEAIEKYLKTIEKVEKSIRDDHYCPGSEIEIAVLEIGNSLIDIFGLPRLRDPMELMREAAEERLLHRRSVPDFMREEVFKRDGYKCKNCGREDNLAADHIYPFSKGGLTSIENLQTLCRPCNSRKGARA